jgi:hypothetical protein
VRCTHECISVAVGETRHDVRRDVTSHCPNSRIKFESCPQWSPCHNFANVARIAKVSFLFAFRESFLPFLQLSHCSIHLCACAWAGFMMNTTTSHIVPWPSTKFYGKVCRGPVSSFYECSAARTKESGRVARHELWISDRNLCLRLPQPQMSAKVFLRGEDFLFNDDKIHICRPDRFVL